MQEQKNYEAHYQAMIAGGRAGNFALQQIHPNFNHFMS